MNQQANRPTGQQANRPTARLRQLSRQGKLKLDFPFNCKIRFHKTSTFSDQSPHQISYSKHLATQIHLDSTCCISDILSKKLVDLFFFVGLFLFLAPQCALAATNKDFFLNPEFLNQIKEKPYLEVAVLPVQNFSIDPDVSYFFRQRLVEDLKAKGFSVISLDQLDQTLYDMGLTHSGQLALLSFSELTQRINADLFLSGAIDQAATQHGGIYNGYVYTCSLKLQDQSGENLWFFLQERFSKRRFAIDPVNALFDVVLAEKGGNKKAAISALADKMLSKFPDGPTKVLIGDSLLDAAVEIPVVTNETLEN